MVAQDAGFYLASGAFAGGTLAVAVSADYREWSAMAMGPYLAAAALSLWMWQRGRASGGAGRRRLRACVIVGVLLTAVVVPLAFQLVWRADGVSGAHAQPEVAVIERAGDRAARLVDPYPQHPTTPGIAPSNDRRSIDETAFFPYLPGMVPFGMTNAISGPRELTDARVTLAGVTLLITLAALLLAPGGTDSRWRALQMLVVFPTGALPLVTGGDDLPVLALMLFGLVLAARRRPVLAGLVIGTASSLKFTAWGVLVLLAFAAVDRNRRPAAGRYLLAVAAVAVPVVAAGVLAGPHAFLVNAVEFPLGLAHVASPAASPLPGQELVVLLPHLKRLITALLLLLGLSIVAWALVTRTPREPSQVARFAALAIVLAIVIAPATRFGYFIYPLNLIVWTRLLRPPADGYEEAAVPGEETSSTGVALLLEA
ncbi:MAG: glycosyltransferase 87 family protein [Acidimicrobiales bacterium]